MKDSKIKTLAVTISLILGSTMLFASIAEAGVGNSVQIDETVLSRCGDHQVAFSGVATYGPGNQELVISLDGTIVSSTFDEPANWAFLVPVTTGPHDLTVQVKDLDVSKNAQATSSINVATCEATNDGGNGGDTGNGGGGGGDETDCCPGPDENNNEPKATKKPQVKGATTITTAPGDLTPMNSIFRSVFGRTPTFNEWKYWADRYLSDKPAWDAILGAMQWQKLQGLTIGA